MTKSRSLGDDDSPNWHSAALTHSRATLARLPVRANQPTLRLADSLLNPRWMSFSAAATTPTTRDVCCLRKDDPTFPLAVK